APSTDGAYSMAVLKDRPNVLMRTWGGPSGRHSCELPGGAVAMIFDRRRLLGGHGGGRRRAASVPEPGNREPDESRGEVAVGDHEQHRLRVGRDHHDAGS